jgi:hypothetical protein
MTMYAKVIAVLNPRDQAGQGFSAPERSVMMFQASVEAAIV